MKSRRSDGRGLEHAWKCTQYFNRNRRKEKSTARVERIVVHREIDGEDIECIYLAQWQAPMNAV
jgi:hypothetical protein